MFIAIIPAYNEENNISTVIQELKKCVDRIVVIDDGSRDNTAQKAESAGATVLRHGINRGQGAALQTGHEYALQINADYILHFDSDNQFCANDVIPALSKIKETNADILIGSRFLDNRTSIPWMKKNVVFPISRIINTIFIGKGFSDIHNGFRILTKNTLRKITIKQDRMAHATEILGQIKKHHLKYTEFPVKIVYHNYGQRASQGLTIIKDLVFKKFIK